MKVKFIAREKTREFQEGQTLEAKYPKNGNKKIVVIKNERDEYYGYPASWFEIVEEEK